MPTLRIAEEEIDRRGEELYRERVRKLVETPENLGRQVVIDVETGDYEVDADGIATMGFTATSHKRNAGRDREQPRSTCKSSRHRENLSAGTVGVPF